MIKVITEPGVYLVGRQEVNVPELDRYLEAVGAPMWDSDSPHAPEVLVEVGSRSCYSSFANPRPGGNAAHLAHVIESQHGSVLEHAVWTIALTGISRSLSHELVRHRHISPSQLSQRFYDESKASFICPPLLIGCEDTSPYDEWLDACDWALSRYHRLVQWFEAKSEVAALEPTMRRKRAREAARSVLPNCVETRIVLTGNARALRWLCELRGTIYADLEFRRLACLLLRRLKQEAPSLFADMDIETDSDGRESVKCGHRKT